MATCGTWSGRRQKPDALSKASKFSCFSGLCQTEGLMPKCRWNRRHVFRVVGNAAGISNQRGRCPDTTSTTQAGASIRRHFLCWLQR